MATHGDPSGDLPASFVGREHTLAALANFVFTSSEPILVLVGPPGGGKTVLLHEFARRYHAQRTFIFVDIANIRGGQWQNAVGLMDKAARRNSVFVVDDSADQLSADVSIRLIDTCALFAETKVVVACRPERVRRVESRSSPFLAKGINAIVLPPFTFQETRDLWAADDLDLTGKDLAGLYGVAGGNPRVAKITGDLVRSGVYSVEEILAQSQPFRRPGLYGPDGEPAHPGSLQERRLLQCSSWINDQLLTRFLDSPEKLLELTPRQFEELVADLLARQGFEVSLTPVSRDGGKDILAAQSTALGSFLFLVECKRQSPERPVGVEVVRQLYGVVQAERVNGGIIATTSYFSADAERLRRELKFQIGFRDYLALSLWLNKVLARW